MNDHQRKLYVGIDVHSREHKVAFLPIALLEQPGAVWTKGKSLGIRNDITDLERLDTAIRSRISSPEEVAIAVDYTGGHYSEPIVYFLQTKGYTVYHLEAKAIKAAKERFLDEESKSDVIDSISAAYMLYLRDTYGISFRISAMMPELGSKAAALNSLVLQRWQLNKLATQATNRLHQFLIAVFPEGEAQYFNQLMKIIPYYPTPKDMLDSNGLEGIEKLSQKYKENILQLAANSIGIPSDIYQWLIKDLSIQRVESLAKRDALTSVLRTQVAAHPYSDILLSFPFLGEIAAATIIAVIKDIERWPDKKKFKKALGVYSSLTQSGGSSGHGRQGKEGSRHGRRVLFQVCFGCIRTNAHDNDFRDYYLRQVARGKPKIKALVSTMGKLAEIIYHCLKAGEPYHYQGIHR
ncbi:transposase [Chloroflexota bacterium]